MFLIWGSGHRIHEARAHFLEGFKVFKAQLTGTIPRALKLDACMGPSRFMGIWVRVWQIAWSIRTCWLING